MSPNMLSRTLAIKERLRQWRRAELHEANTEVARAQERVDEHAAEQQLATEAVTAQGEVSANELALHAEQLERTQRALKKAREILAKCEGEADNRREQVGEATREMKAIEVLRDRALAEQRREQGLREQRDADETSSRKGVKRP
jgi:flagellar export protein FliJ